MKKKISILLVLVLLFSFTINAFADDLGDITDFDKLKKAIHQKNSSFKTNEDKNYFRHKYWKTVLPDLSVKKYPKQHEKAGEYIRLNNDSVDVWKIFYYGYGSLIPNNTRDLSGNHLYIGYTADGEYVTNLKYNEGKMKNPKKVLVKDYYNTNKKYYGNARPFKTDYTNYLIVGKWYLGRDADEKQQEQYGKEIISEWMKKTIVRDTGWETPGKTFYEVFNGNVDEFIKYVTITSPPTSRSNGQAVVWFEHDSIAGGGKKNPNTGKYETRRTYIINPTDPVNFKAKEYTWNEETKILNVKYEIEGVEKIEGELFNVITLDTFPYEFGGFVAPLVKDLPKYFKEEYITKSYADGKIVNLAYNDGKELHQAAYADQGDDEWIFYMTRVDNVKPELEDGKIKRVFEVSFNFGFLEDYREEDLLLDVRINEYDADEYTGETDFGAQVIGFPEYHEDAYFDNHILARIPATGLDFDLKHEDGEETREFKVKEGTNAKVPVKAKLLNAIFEEDVDIIKTNITIHDEKGKILDTLEDVEFNKEDIKDGVILEEIELEIDKKHLKPGKNTLYAVINSNFDLTKSEPIKNENNLENNKIEIIINLGDVDFAIYPEKALIKKSIKDTSDINLEFEVELTGVDKPINTVVDLYKDNKKIDSKNVTVDGVEKVTFSINRKGLKEGANNFYAVVNADYDLKIAKPYKEEKFLENNRTSITVLYEDNEEIKGECEFKGSSREETYAKRECVKRGYDEKGRRICLVEGCVEYTAPTTNSAKLEYIEYDISSNIYRADVKGQDFGKSKGVHKGKDLDGKPAYDELMAKNGYNPLYQVIQTGRGMQVKGVIKLEGVVQEFTEVKADGLIREFVEDIKQNIYAGSKAKNNEGKEYQEMIEDKRRSGKYNVKLERIDEFGDECKKIKRYTKSFDVEIPILVDKAKGTIDIINRNPKPKNPNENKYFVYANTEDGVYQMKLRTDINPKKLGVNQGISKCIIEPDEFKFAVYGSMFELINTGGDNEDPYWDN